MSFSLSQKLLAEAVGTAFLLAVVVGSGIMAESLAAGNDAVALLGNTLATGAILVVLILIFGPVSGAHFNPAVTFSFLLRKEISLGLAGAFVAVQVVGGFAGVAIAHAMFDLQMVQTGVKVRSGPGQWLAEGVATFGLVMTILGCVRFRPEAVPYAVGLFITAGYWFTSSTSFANPAVTLARSFSDTFAGIRLDDAPAFIAAQMVAAGLATLFARCAFQQAARGLQDANTGASKKVTKAA
ncbi:MAG: MIP/aquaporin family protein [Pseudomonadota bacterium]